MSVRESAESNKRRSNKPRIDVLSESEWKVLWLAQERTRPPSEVPPTRWAYETLGKLGGRINGQRTGRVGWEAMWKGWFRLQERHDTYLAMPELCADT